MARKNNRNKKKKQLNNNNNSGAQVNRKQGVRPKRQRRLMPASQGMNCCLSRVACQYCKVLIHPFSGQVSGIPRWPNTPSLKTYQWSKGTLYTSTTSGFGYVTLNPFWAFSNISATGGTSGFISFSSSPTLFVGTSVDGTVGTAGTTVVASNSQFNSSDLGTSTASIQYRIVAAGLRIRYAGTELNRGGIVAGVQMPDHGSIIGATMVSVQSMDEHQTFRPGNGWITLTYQPSNANEVEFVNSISTVFTGNSSYSMAFVITDPGVSIGFEFEGAIVVEYTGSPARGKSSSPGDEQGFSAVSSSYSNVEAKRPHNQQDSTSRVMNFLGRAEKALGQSSIVAGIGKLGSSIYNKFGPGVRSAISSIEDVTDQAARLAIADAPYVVDLA